MSLAAAKENLQKPKYCVFKNEVTLDADWK